MHKIAAIAISAAAVFLAAAPALADDPVPQGPDADTLNLGASWDVLCSSPGDSSYKFSIFYNSGPSGAWRNIGYSVYDFDALRPGDGHSHPLRFCSGGASSPPKGSGERIKNNAAAAENSHYKYWSRVYYNSGYKGNQDALAPYQSTGQFRKVYNENASFQWTYN
ncbi:hypothetical protein [Streptomyces sp. ERV7]|uniref:hypothetical protein n=1 Tax=Streptomyces sp. ERV7 TaxID=1322334 RepID=UPI00131AE490|nr:hypothetical protein [Streptomyces sp. ERV7]